MPCYRIRLDNGATGFMCGDFGPHCSDANCGGVGDFLCDFPVADGKTCDASLCRHHAFEVAPGMHYCPGHALAWRQFKESGGVDRELEKVTPYAVPIPVADVDRIAEVVKHAREIDQFQQLSNVKLAEKIAEKMYHKRLSTRSPK